MSDIFIGRQPIFDRSLEVIGYELLYRSGDVSAANVVDGDRATGEVLVNTFLEIGLERVVGGRLAFINLTPLFLQGDVPLPFSRDRVVLEVLEDVVVDAELLGALRRLAELGYRVALDDFVYRDELVPLLSLASIVKLDVQVLDTMALERHVLLLRDWGVELLAEKVETPAELEVCQALGFEYFQGYFLCRPYLLKGRQMPANRLAVLSLLSRLQDESIQFEELEKIVAQDVSLSYKLLRLINSAFYGLPAKVESIRQALVLLGVHRIRAWVSLFALSSLDDKPSELMVTAMARARMCELLGEARSSKSIDSFFTAGLFSALDALFDMPMQEILDTLPLTPEISDALLLHAGDVGKALHCVLAYERGDWPEVAHYDLEAGVMRDLYLEALAWVETMRSQLTAA